MSPHRYRLRPIVVEARQVNAADWEQVEHLAAWCGGQVVDSYLDGTGVDAGVIFLPDVDNDGNITDGDYAADGEWIVKGPGGTFYIMIDAVFALTYEPVTP